jgi:hypothetical protein
MTPRRIIPTVIVVIASILVFLSIYAIWIRRQALEPETWTNTSAEVLEDPTVQSALATYLADQLYANVDVEAQIASALPPRLDRLAGPIAGALYDSIERTARKTLARQDVQLAWRNANLAAQQQLLTLLDGGGEFTTVEGGTVTLDLHEIVSRVATRAGIDPGVADRLPPDAAQLVVMRSDQLGLAQDIVRLIRGLSIVLPLLAIALFAAAIAIARERRRETLRSVAVGIVAAGVGVLLCQSVAGDAVVDALATNPFARPAAEQVWTIGTSLLVAGAGAVILYGLALLVGTSLAGPTRWAVALRRVAAPYTAAKYVYPAAVVLLVGLLAWGPTEGLRRPLPALVLVLLLLVGFEALRRTVAAAPRAAATEAPPAPA